MKLSVYKGRCGRGNGIYHIARAKIWKPSGECVQRYSVFTRKSHGRVFEERYRFEKLDWTPPRISLMIWQTHAAGIISG